MAGSNVEHKVRVIFEVITGGLQQQVRQSVNQLRQFGTQGQQAGQQASRGLRQAGDASEDANNDLRQLVEQLGRAGNAAEGLSKKINTAFKALLTGYVTKQIIGFGQTAVTEYGKTQTALGEMASLGYEDLEGLRQAAVDFTNVWSGSTRDQFISSAYDIKSGIASLSDEGVAKFTEMAGLTAKATKASIDEMTALFATGYGIYRNRFGSDFDFGEQFAAGIAKSVQQFKTKGSEMASYLSTLGSSANQAGASLSEILSIGGTLQATMTGSEAATKYNSFLKNAVKAGKALGLTFTDANNQLLSTADILQILHDQYGEVLQADEKYELAKAFGDEEAVKLIENLYNKIQDVRVAQGQVNDAMREGMGFVEGMAQHMNEGVLEKIQILKQSWGNLLDVMGERMASGVLDGLDTLNRTIIRLQSSADFAAIGDQIGVVISKLAQLMQKALESGAVDRILSVLANHLDDIIDLLVKGAGAWLAFQTAGSLASTAFNAFSIVGDAAESINEIRDVIDSVSTSTGRLGSIWSRFTGIMSSIKTWFMALPPQAKVAVIALAAIAAVLLTIITTSESFQRAVQNAMMIAQMAILDFASKGLDALEKLLRKIPVVGQALGDMAAEASGKLKAMRDDIQRTYNALNAMPTDKPSKADVMANAVGDLKQLYGQETSIQQNINMELPNLRLGVGNSGGSSKSSADPVSAIADKYQPELELYESRADLAEKQNDYTTEKINRQNMLDVLNRQVKELMGLENTQTGRNKMVIETARNRLLAQIAEITEDIRGGISSMAGEFNKPAGMDALNYYDYMISKAAPGTVGTVLYGGNNKFDISLVINGGDEQAVTKAKENLSDLLGIITESFATTEELNNALAGTALGSVGRN